ISGSEIWPPSRLWNPTSTGGLLGSAFCGAAVVADAPPAVVPVPPLVALPPPDVAVAPPVVAVAPPVVAVAPPVAAAGGAGGVVVRGTRERRRGAEPSGDRGARRRRDHRHRRRHGLRQWRGRRRGDRRPVLFGGWDGDRRRRQGRGHREGRPGAGDDRPD